MHANYPTRNLTKIQYNNLTRKTEGRHIPYMGESKLRHKHNTKMTLAGVKIPKLKTNLAKVRCDQCHF